MHEQEDTVATLFRLRDEKVRPLYDWYCSVHNHLYTTIVYRSVVIFRYSSEYILICNYMLATRKESEKVAAPQQR